jgi:N-acetylmuramoyl-L-alanine amidase
LQTPTASSSSPTSAVAQAPSADVTKPAIAKPAITKAPSSANPSSLRLVPKFIDFPQQRKDEMAKYSLRHYGASSWQLKPTMIVLHFTETDTAESARNTFANDSPNLGELPGTCAHFIVAQNGDVWQIVPTSVRCRHTIGLNDKAIGIEMVQRTQGNSSHWADQQILDRPAQIGAVLALLGFLQRDYGISTSNIIGHAMANDALQFRDLQGWRNDHTDWQAQDVLEVRRRLSAIH